MASDKVLKMIEDVKALTVLELSELVKALEEEFGVSAAAPVAMAPVSNNGDTKTDVDVKTDFDVVLVEAGQAKMGVIKIVKEITGLGLKEAKELVDGAPKAVKEGVSSEEAEALKKQLEEAGAKIELK